MEGEIQPQTDVKPAYSAYTDEELATMADETIATAMDQIPQLHMADPAQVTTIVKNALAMMAEFENVARGHHPPVYVDTDIVWVPPGPGMYDNTLDPEIQDRYIDLPWSRNLNWARILTGAALVREVTAKRLHKRTAELTQDYIKEHGPFLLYNCTPLEAQHMEHVLAKKTTKIPREKVFLYTDVASADGTTRPMVNTADQVESLRFPDDMVPRRLVIVSNGPHLTRMLHMLGNFSGRVPENTIVQPYPTPTPPAGRITYPIMETRGILAGIYKDKTATPVPHRYKL